MHNECYLQFLYFGEIPKLKSRLLCERCIIGVFNAQDKQPALVFLKDFLNNPGDQVMKITRLKELNTQGNEIELIEQIEQLLLKFEDVVTKQIESIRQNISSLKAGLRKMITDINDNLKLNEIVSQIQLLGRMDSYQGTNELAELEEQLNTVSENLNNTYNYAKERAKDNQVLIVNNFQNNVQTIQNEIDQFYKMSLDVLSNMICLEMPAILQEDLGEFPQIQKQISQGKQIQYQLIYQGTRDGLHGSKYWAKCNNQSNLLTIMTSNNGNRFGGYSSCLINSNITGYVQDPTMKSFLFQYNKKEVYQVKNQAKAVYCNIAHGPTYGGHDIYIAVDLNSGSSSGLGNSYDLTGFNVVDKASHIFGATTPQLEECKVYKVIF